MNEPLQHWIDGESVASLEEYLETKSVVVSL